MTVWRQPWQKTAIIKARQNLCVFSLEHLDLLINLVISKSDKYSCRNANSYQQILSGRY